MTWHSSRSQEKLAHFKNPSVYKAMKFICVNEMLSGRPVPNYGQIITEISQAIADYKWPSSFWIVDWLIIILLVNNSEQFCWFKAFKLYFIASVVAN